MNQISQQTDDRYIATWFQPREFACNCCGVVKIDKTFLMKLDEARTIAGVPFIITSGYRCPKHNAEVGGVKNSAHMAGLAADIACPDSTTRLHILRGLIKAGFRRIGIGENFIHADIDKSKPNRIWHYYHQYSKETT